MSFKFTKLSITNKLSNLQTLNFKLNSYERQIRKT